MQPYSSQSNSIPNIKNLSTNNSTSPLYINNQLPPLPISQNNTNLHDTRTKKRTRKDRACKYTSYISYVFFNQTKVVLIYIVNR